MLISVHAVWFFHFIIIIFFFYVMMSRTHANTKKSLEEEFRHFYFYRATLILFEFCDRKAFSFTRTKFAAGRSYRFVVNYHEFFNFNAFDIKFNYFRKVFNFFHGAIYSFGRDLVEGTRNSRKYSPIRHPKEDGNLRPTPFFSPGSFSPRRCPRMDTKRQFIYLLGH